MKKIFGIAAVLLSTQWSLCAETAAPVNAKNAAAILQMPRYPAIRVGDIAPTLSGTDTTGKEWTTRANYGLRATALFFDGGYPVFEPWLQNAKVAGDTSQSYKSGVAIAIVSSHFLAANRFDEKSQAMIFRTSSSELQDAFGAMRRVVIDRAGFVRRIEDSPSGAGMQGSFARGINDPTPQLEVGKAAPDFSMPDMNGTVRRVGDLRGKKNLLLTFFPKCFTGGCTNHLTSIQKEYLQYLASDAEVWAVSVDEAEGEKGQIAFANRWGFQFPFIPDVGRNLSLLYGAAHNPQQLASRMSVLIDKDGIVRLIDKNVNIFTHGSDMILQMRHLGMVPSVATPPTAAIPTAVTPTAVTPALATQATPSQTRPAAK